MNASNPTDSSAIHPLVQPLADVLGTWTGKGHGKYTGPGFDYNESVSLSTLPGKTYVIMENTSTSPEGNPMHVELGFLRIVSEATQNEATQNEAPEQEKQTIDVELIMAQATGQAEILYGTVTRDEHELRIDVTSDTVHNTATAKTVDATHRLLVFDLDNQKLTHTMDMEAVGKPMENHLKSELSKMV